MPKSLGSNLGKGISLKVLKRVISRLQEKYPDGVLRVSNTLVAFVRFEKTRYGYSSEFVDLTETEQTANAVALEKEEKTLTLSR